MINERFFAERYTSFWHRSLPMGEEFTKAINGHLQEQFADPRPELDEVLRPSLVSELGLRWFGACAEEGELARARPEEDVIERISAEVTTFINRLAGSPDPPLPPPSQEERREAEALAGALATFVGEHAPGEMILPHPRFDGCGLLAPSRGDLLVGETLYEVKAVDQGFRQPHVRQLVIYCALNSAHPQHEIRAIGLINPKRGTYFRSDLEWIVPHLSGGLDPTELFHEVLDFLSTERVSA